MLRLERNLSHNLRNADVSRTKILILGIAKLPHVFSKRSQMKLSSSRPFSSCVVLPERR